MTKTSKPKSDALFFTLKEKHSRDQIVAWIADNKIRYSSVVSLGRDAHDRPLVFLKDDEKRVGIIVCYDDELRDLATEICQKYIKEPA